MCILHLQVYCMKMNHRDSILEHYERIMEGEYYKTKETAEEYIRLAKDVSGKQLIEKLQKNLVANSFLLEIGSGPGTDWRILNDSYQITGSDNSKEFLKHLIKENANE